MIVKKIMHVAAFAVLAFALSSCMKGETGGEMIPSPSVLEEKILLADFSDTKTSFDGKTKTSWVEGDSIAVLDKKDFFRFSATQSGATTTFVGSATAGSTEFAAIYPYVSGSSTGILTSDSRVMQGQFLPITQKVADGSQLPVYATFTTTGKLHFNPLCIVFKFSIGDKFADKFKSITITTENGKKISGYTKVNFSTGNVEHFTSGSVQYTTYAPESGNISAGTYYVGLYPTGQPDDVTELERPRFTFTLKDGSVLELTIPVTVNAKRGVIYNFGELNIDKANPLPSGSAVYGYVMDSSGAPVPDAVVSDGFTCTKSGKDGWYCLTRPHPERTNFVFVSTPKGYEPLIDDGLPVFYTRLSAYSKNVPCRANLTISKMEESQDEFYFVFTADPQARKSTKTIYETVAFKSEDTYEDMFTDIKEYVQTLGKPCYGIALGDICFNDPTVYPQYVAGMKKIGIPFYGVIGNHDHQATGVKSDDAAAVDFEKVFGPRNFSFNIGGIHIISLDDIYFEPTASGTCLNTEYSTSIEDEFLQWVKEDISYVDPGTPVFVCVHSPLAGQNGVSSSYHNAQNLLNLLSGYKVYLWAGHIHYNNSKSYKSDSSLSSLANVESHSLSRTTGMLGLSEYCCSDGTPRGYVVLHAKGSDISWKFKPTAVQNSVNCGIVPPYKWREWDYVGGRAQMRDGSGLLDDTYQIRAYNRGDYDDNFVYANVFMWDDSWGTPTITYGGHSYKMTKSVFYDMGYREYIEYYSANSSYFAKKEKEYAGSSRYHHFSYEVPESASGKATISVTDRFGDVYSREVSIDPITYTDGNLHLVFDFTSNQCSLPTSVTNNVSFKYTIGGTQYSFLMERGYFNSSRKYLALNGAGKSLVLPAISGYKLVGVSARTSNNTSDRHALIATTSTTTSDVTGGYDKIFCGNCTDNWSLSGTVSGKQYRLVCVSSGFPLAELRLTYSKTQ